MTRLRRVRNFIERLAENWERTAIRVYQDYEWQDLLLPEVKDEVEIAEWIIECLKGLV